MQIIEILSICVLQIFLYLLVKNKFYNSKFVQKLIDKPGKNKIHFVPVPLIGGILLFFSILVYLILSIAFDEYQLVNKKILIIIIGTLFAFLVGFVDDFLHIKAEKKLLAISIFNVIFFQNLDFFQVEILIFESSFFLLQISSVSLSLIISVLAFLVCHYALVIIDGVNGIFGSYVIGLLFIILLFFEISYPLKNFIFYLLIVLSFITLLNLKNNLFFGNSGSLMLSAMIPYMLLTVYNDRNSQIFLFSYISLVIIPVLDMMRIFFQRLYEKKSPFEKDLNHFHHKLLGKYSLHKSLIIYLGVCYIPFFTIEILKFDSFIVLLIQITFFFVLNRALNVKKN